MPQLWNPSTKNLRKILYFHHTVEIKQPYAMIEPSFIPLELQGKKHQLHTITQPLHKAEHASNNSRIMKVHAESL